LKRPKYLLVMPNGVGIRNFFCTRFIDLLLESGDVIVWHALPAESIAEFQGQWGERVQWRVLPPIRDGLLERLLRQAKATGQLYWQMKQGPDIQLKRRRPPARWGPRLVSSAAEVIGCMSGGPARIVLLDRLHRAVAARSGHMPVFDALLREIRPNVVFCAHQKALRAVPVMLAARKLGIPSATFIYSWDNLPKGRMAVYADYYFVWSEFMKNELLGYYPDVTPDRVRIVGTPQFEPYSDESLFEPRAVFLQRLNLDPARPVVCFSGDDVLTSPYDPVYLEDLAEACESIPLPKRPQILFRRSPVDRSHRYASVLTKYPEIAVSDPPWKAYSDADWAEVVPTPADTALLVNVVRHCDLVVNLASTMAMDFAVYDKPGIYVAYNPKAASPSAGGTDCYRLPHMKSVHELQPVYWARSPKELGQLVLHALRNPQEKQAERKAWLHRHVLQPMGEASERLAEALKELALGVESDAPPASAETIPGDQIRRRASTR
jgi:hypothetical protein